MGNVIDFCVAQVCHTMTPPPIDCVFEMLGRGGAKEVGRKPKLRGDAI